MCKEVLDTGKIIVKRPDAKELLEIRNGNWSYDKLIETADSLEKDIEKLFLTTKLPKVSDRVKLDNLCVSLVERSLNK